MSKSLNQVVIFYRVYFEAVFFRKVIQTHFIAKAKGKNLWGDCEYVGYKLTILKILI